MVLVVVVILVIIQLLLLSLWSRLGDSSSRIATELSLLCDVSVSSICIAVGAVWLGLGAREA